MKQILIFLLLCSIASGATEVIRYVDTGSAAAGDGTTPALSGGNHAYQSLEAGLAASEADISVGTGTDEQWTFHLNRTGGGGMDTTTADIGDGWTTAAANFIKIVQDDFPADGILDATKYVLHNDDTDARALFVRENYVRLVNMQIQTTSTLNSTRHGIEFDGLGAGDNDPRIEGCIIKGVASGTGSSNGIYSNSSNNNIKIFNCVIYDFQSGADTGHAGVSTGLPEGPYVMYNSTIYKCGYGVYGYVTATNCIIGYNNDDLQFATADYCMTDDGDGTNVQAPSGSDWGNELNDANNGDFTLLSGGNGAGNGTDDPGSGLYVDDIRGVRRASPWDIGAFGDEAAGVTGQFMIISKDFWGRFVQNGINGKWIWN